METATLTRKEQLAQTATELFRQKGYKAASMRDLAQAVGIEAASLYSHIKSKEELLQSICFRMAQDFFASLDAAEAGAATATQKLQLAVAAHCLVLTRDTAASAVFLNEWRHLSEPHRSKFLQLREQYESRFRHIIRAGIAAGEFSYIDEKLAVLTLLSSLNWIHHWYKPTGQMTPEQIGAQLSALLLHGLSAAPIQNTKL